MPLKEIIAPTMKELFIQEIEQKIISGEWKTGMKLPTEREMESQMKVSRSIINGGLKSLENKGFIEIRPRQGAYVNDYVRNGNFETLVSIMNYNGGKLDKITFDSLMNYRHDTDCECAYLAALYRTNQDIEELKKYYQKLLNTTDPIVISDLKIKFEHTIYVATRNAIYPLICNSFISINRMFSLRLFKTFGCEDATYCFKELIEAIENKDGEQARFYMSQIMHKRIEQLEKIYY